MADLTSLIERIEAATEGSRELDLVVHLVLFPDGEIAGWMKYPRGLSGREGYSWDISGASIIYEKRTADGRCPHNGGVLLPHVSTSIDDALMLLPGGYDWIIGNVNGMYGGTPYACACAGSTEQHFAATPCLALLSAILKARQTAAQPARSSDQSGVRHD